MSDITQRIADILRRLDEESTGGDLSSRSSTGPEQWAEVLTTELGLTREERSIPVTEYGERWAPRSRAAAEDDMRRYPAGGGWQLPDGQVDPWDGITHIKDETRYVTDWVRE